ncbi:hypothetical protein NB713_002623 [Xanthomonas sacchari]|nr:hypothetical protein [Xanthomonas sacchari]
MAELAAADAVVVAVDHPLAFLQVAALEQHRLRARLQQRGGGALGVVGGVDRAAEQQLRFRHVRRHQRRQRQQALAQRVQGIVLQQLGAAGGHHHRVQHHPRWAIFFQRIGDQVDHLGVGEHAELDRADVEVGEAGIDLCAQERQRRHVYRGDAAGVLCGQRGGRRQPVHAVRGEGLEIRLDAGAAAGIGAGDAQCGDDGGFAHAPIVQGRRGLCTRPRLQRSRLR